MKIKQFHEYSELDDPVVVQPTAFGGEQKLTHLYLAQLATERYKSKLRWNTDERGWHCFDNESGMWQRIGTEQIIALLIVTLSEMRSIEAEKIKISGSTRGSVIKEIERAENSGFLNGAESILRSMPELEIDAAAFDADPYLVGLENGQVLDLRTSSVRAINQTDYLTKRINTPYIAGATSQLWEKSIRTWACDDEELAKFLQVWCGYCLSGLTNFQGFLFLHGGGRNGKSVFVNVISRLLGPYAIAMKSDTLIEKPVSNGPSGDIARLKGVRFATCNELPEGKHFNEELLKSLTGQDTLTARFSYQDDFNFKPNLKLMICGNHQPVIKGVDNGVWRRVNIVPFVASIPEEAADPDLTDDLINELAGILNWCIEGWKTLQQQGMKIQIPSKVKAATAHYKSDMDILGDWLEEKTEQIIGSKSHLKEMYRSYGNWCQENGFRSVPTSKSFNRKLKERGLGEPLRDAVGFYYPDIEVRYGTSYEYVINPPLNHRFDKD